MRKIEEVLRLHHECGRSNRAMAEAVRASPTTVGDYLRRARLAKLPWPLPDGMSEAALEAALFPPVPASKVSRPEPNWAAVHRQVGRAGVTLDLLWQAYRECLSMATRTDPVAANNIDLPRSQGMLVS